MNAHIHQKKDNLAIYRVQPKTLNKFFLRYLLECNLLNMHDYLLKQHKNKAANTFPVLMDICIFIDIRTHKYT